MKLSYIGRWSPTAGLLRCIVVLLMSGLCHIAAEAGSRVAAKIDLSGRQAIKPLDSAHDQAPGAA